MFIDLYCYLKLCQVARVAGLGDAAVLRRRDGCQSTEGSTVERLRQPALCVLGIRTPRLKQRGRPRR